MKANTTIQKIYCSFLICIFALSITPKIIIHNLVADHKDFSYINKSYNGHQLSKAGFNCHFENLVAESPFVSNIKPIQIICPLPSEALKQSFLNSFYTTRHYYSSLRGPPCHFQNSSIG